MFIQKQRLKDLLYLSSEPQIITSLPGGVMKTGLIYWSHEPWWERHCLGRESAQPGVFADIWKELWKSPQIQWFPVKHFLTHHLEFDYEVNRLEFCTRDVIFPLPLVSSAIKTCLSALSNDNDKCSRGKRCHEKHTKDFSEGKKRTSTPRWTLFQRRNYAQWESKNEMLAALLRLW